MCTCIAQQFTLRAMHFLDAWERKVAVPKYSRLLWFWFSFFKIIFVVRMPCFVLFGKDVYRYNTAKYKFQNKQKLNQKKTRKLCLSSTEEAEFLPPFFFFLSCRNLSTVNFLFKQRNQVQKVKFSMWILFFFVSRVLRIHPWSLENTLKCKKNDLFV